jgi:hypothetical protein
MFKSRPPETGSRRRLLTVQYSATIAYNHAPIGIERFHRFSSAASVFRRQLGNQIKLVPECLKVNDSDRFQRDSQLRSAFFSISVRLFLDCN